MVMCVMADSEDSLGLSKEPESKVVNVGDLVQWIEGCVDKFETPRRVRAIQTYGGQEWAFVEGSATRVPISKLVVVAATSGATVAPPTTAFPVSVARRLASEGRGWLPGRSFGPEEHISSKSLLPLMLAFALGAVASAGGIYFFEGMNRWRSPPPSAIAKPPLPPQSATAAALPSSSPVVGPQPSEANLSPIEPGAAASSSPKPAVPMSDQPRLSPSEIAEIQVRLESLGMNPGSQDGVWGPQTAAAIRRYEKSKGQPQIGKVSRELLERLRGEALAIQAPPVAAAPAEVKASVPDANGPIQDEVSPSDVFELQLRLELLGMRPGLVDGVAGAETTAAIKRYEESKGQPQTGKLDRALLERLRQESN
jgi:peptidoglycan hydrolase-like protein with peptidoglycan-binding domain